MSNLLFPKYKEALLAGGVNLSSGTVKAVLIDLADYTYNSAHDFLDDVPSGARVGTPQTLGSKTTTGGVFDAADVTFPTVTGDQSEAVLIYRDSGVEASSELIALIDTATGLPVTPSGGNIIIAWHASGIFAL